MSVLSVDLLPLIASCSINADHGFGKTSGCLRAYQVGGGGVAYLRPVTFRTGGVAEGIVYCIISFYFQIYFFICRVSGLFAWLHSLPWLYVSEA